MSIKNWDKLPKLIKAYFSASLYSSVPAPGRPAVKAYAALSWNAPSPINPYDFVEF